MSKISIKNLDLYYGDFKALKDVNLEIESNKITAFIGPSGCGKSTLLKSINRMNDLVEGCRIEGEILLDGENIFKGMDVNMLRKRVGMVFQKPNPFPMSIYDNIAFGPRTHGIHSKAKLDDIVEKSLRNAAIWDECKDRLRTSALGMSGGQQQRLCIARALAVEPEVLLMDEPTSALDPISTSKIEDLAMELKKDYTIVMVTHNMQQAVRVSDNTAFFLLGEVVEYNDTEKLFSIRPTSGQKTISQGGSVKLCVTDLMHSCTHWMSSSHIWENSARPPSQKPHRRLRTAASSRRRSLFLKTKRSISARRTLQRLCLKLLLQQQPVAKDLRRISAALKMITDMERIGDQTSDIAEIIISTKDQTAAVDDISEIGNMASRVSKMVRDSVTAYVNRDLELARNVMQSDDEVDAYFDEIRDKMIAYIKDEKGQNGRKIFDLIMVTKYLERIGDHATNIAEWVEFSITGVHKDSAIIHES